ncbi:ROK family transcriptional regulator [Motilibacter aurantiacus]|uniref:ROK family transcriptional regulator n=1 Tax=Motilibacter aurantiacus TaxID=2714955 RepID=UPI002F2B6294
MRRSNLSLVLRRFRDEGPRTRARVADETGLNKATVSSLVAELVERGLLREGQIERLGAVGRPGQVIELDGRRVCGIGIEVNVDYMTALIVDLAGRVVADERVPLDVPALGAEAVLDATADLVARAVAAAEAAGSSPAGVTVAVPALVDVATGTLRFAPNFGWRDMPMASAVAERLGGPPYPIRVDNDANLSALAEHVAGEGAGVNNLVYLTGEVGVGAGVISDGRLLRGSAGLSGEVGHMPLGAGTQRCGCGRRGCWETTVGLAALLRMAAGPKDPVRDPARDVEDRLTELRRRAEEGHERTLAALRQIGTDLGTGASVLVNLFDPELIMLGGYFAMLGDFFLEDMIDSLRARVVDPDTTRCKVVLSTLGFSAAARGGAHVALESVLADPTTVPAVANAPSRSPASV